MKSVKFGFHTGFTPQNAVRFVLYMGHEKQLRISYINVKIGRKENLSENTSAIKDYRKSK